MNIVNVNMRFIYAKLQSESHVVLNLFQHRISERPCDPEINSGRRKTRGIK